MIDLFLWFRERFPRAQIARVEVTSADGTHVQVRTARPGLLIGKAGAVINRIKSELEAEVGPIELTIVELRRPELEPVLVADNIVLGLERGVSLERALELNPQVSIRAGAKKFRLRLTGAFGEHERVLAAQGFDGAEELARHAVVEGSTESGAVRCEVWIW